MTGSQRGFALLCSHLGDPQRKPLTTARFRQLARRVRNAENPGEDRDLALSDLKALGCSAEESARILALLSEEDRLDRYLHRAKRADCALLTPFHGRYPPELEHSLGEDAPPLLWYKGDPSLLSGPKIALVGSRDILPPNAEFARQVGLQAATQGFTLISGNARGADRIAQTTCLEAGGRVISILADSLETHRPAPNQLLLSEDSFDLEFSPVRALSRNRIIHGLAQGTLVAQCSYQKGGTWDGTTRNLRHGWSRVCCFADGSHGAAALEQMGAELIGFDDLDDFSKLVQTDPNFLNM